MKAKKEKQALDKAQKAKNRAMNKPKSKPKNAKKSNKPAPKPKVARVQSDDDEDDVVDAENGDFDDMSGDDISLDLDKLGDNGGDEEITSEDDSERNLSSLSNLYITL